MYFRRDNRVNLIMLLIHRSILKELLLSFLLSIFFLNFTLMMEKLLRLSRLLSGVGASIADIARIFIYLQPQILILTLPMGLLLSVLLTYGRMNTDSELIVLRGSGMSFRSISLPVGYLGLACFIFSLIMSFYLGPKGSVLLREKVTAILSQRAAMSIEEGIFNTAFKDVILLVKEKPAPDRLAGVFIVDDRNKDEQKVIIAKEATINQTDDVIGFLLVNGHAYIIKKKALTEISFARYHFTLIPSIEPANRKGNEMTPSELLHASKEFPEQKIPFILEFHRRLSMPAVCLILVFLGPSLSLMAGKSGRLGGLTVGLLVFVIYYTLLLYGENLSRTGKLTPILGAWLAFALLVSSSILISERMNKR